MIRRLHPSGFGFWGGVGLGFLIALFAFGNLAHLASLLTPEAWAGPTVPVYRLMDGAHTQLATVDHTGALSVSLSGSGGGALNINHIQSVTHISGRVILQNVAGTAITATGTALDVNCTGCSAASVVNVGHVSAVTHVGGRVMLQNVAGTAVTVTGTALDVNCTGCAAASVVAVSHISGAVHVVNSFGQALHIQGLGVPGGSHGGILTIQGITGMNAVSVVESAAPWTIAHLTSVAHVYGTVSLVNRAGTYASFTGSALDVNCTVCTPDVVNVFHQSTIRHVSSVTHVVGLAGAAIHIQGRGTPGDSHGGVLSVQGVTGMNALSVTQSTTYWNVQHISSAIHLAGGVTDNANSALRVTGVTVFTIQGSISHNSGSLHIAGTIQGARLHFQGVGSAGQSHGGVLTVQGVTGMNPIVGRIVGAPNVGLGVLVTHTGELNINCVSGCSASTLDSVNVFHQSTIRHISSVTHISGGIFLTNQAGVAVTTTSNALDVNCTGCSSSATVHISAAVHLAGSINGARIHVTGLGTPGQTHGGVFTVQGVTGMIGLAVYQDTPRWTVAHVTSVTHVVGAVSLVGRDGTYITFTGTALDVNCTGCSAASTVVVSHNSGSLHVAGTIKGAQFHVTGLGTPGQTHGGVFTIQGVTGMVGVSVYQDTPRWTVAHITSVTHVYGTASLVARDGTYAGFAGTSLLVASSSAQSGTWTIQAAHQGGEWNVRHVSGVIHVSVVSSMHLSGSVHVSGISNIGSGAPGTFTTQMVCHSSLAVHVAAAAPGLTQIIHLTSTNNNTDQTSWRIYICGIVLISAHAQGFSLYEGTGTTCVTGKLPLMGSYRPDDSMVLAGNGGFSAVSPFPWLSTQNPGNNLCLGQTTRASGGTISGVITYRAGP